MAPISFSIYIKGKIETMCVPIVHSLLKLQERMSTDTINVRQNVWDRK